MQYDIWHLCGDVNRALDHAARASDALERIKGNETDVGYVTRQLDGLRESLGRVMALLQNALELTTAMERWNRERKP